MTFLPRGAFRFLARFRPPEPAHLALGRKGEACAIAYLRRHRHKILHHNFRAPHGGEVDIIARDKARNELVFVEVKTRSGTVFGDPHEAVNRQKRHLLLRGAMAWLRMLNMPDLIFRFDIIEVIWDDEEPPELRHHENAFPLPDRYTY